MSRAMTSFSTLLAHHNVTEADVAAALGVTPKAVRNWRNGAYGPSPAMARAIEKEFGIPKHLLRPDIWDAPVEPKSSRRNEKEPA
jgi:transcriptional regulator with XRE-family HTH domain